MLYHCHGKKSHGCSEGWYEGIVNSYSHQTVTAGQAAEQYIEVCYVDCLPRTIITTRTYHHRPLRPIRF
ncbi:unnamed protein product [Nezara viridula]|uniref:Uncharacterized protein n=1 Tax=Nezara viridula TaxID=85310 RepID=A0A9P0MSB0_NEZVI|nr:unnamed protein product [Nezara viridula]